MRTDEDAIRSVRRYVANCMAADPEATSPATRWRVRLAMDGAFKRPFALVSTPGGRALSDFAPLTMRATLPFAIQLYPRQPTVGPMRATEARMLAERAAALLTRGLSVGATDVVVPEVRGYQGRIPLWDYHDEAGVPLPLGGEQAVSTSRFYADYMELLDGWGANVQPEASSDGLFVVTASLRVRWLRSTAEKPTGPLLAGAVIAHPPDHE